MLSEAIVLQASADTELLRTQRPHQIVSDFIWDGDILRCVGSWGVNMEAELHSQGPFHRSRYGLCRRSWRAGPCNRFADCLNCSELLMCKGDKLAVETIEKDRQYLLRTYTAAQQAIQDGERSASRWTQVAGQQIERLTQMLCILNDSRIPDGSPIELTGTDFSHEGTVLENKAAEVGIKLLERNDLAIEYGSELINCLDLLSSIDNA